MFVNGNLPSSSTRLQSFPGCFSFNFIHEVKVALVKVVHSDIAIFTTTGVSDTLRMDSNGVERTKVTSYSANLIFEDFVVKSGLKFALTSRGGCHIHGSLTTSQDDKVFAWCDSSRVEWSIGDECLQNFEVAGGKDSSSLVFTSSDEVCSILGKLNIVNSRVVFMDFDVEEDFAGLKRVSIEGSYLAISDQYSPWNRIV